MCYRRYSYSPTRDGPGTRDFAAWLRGYYGNFLAKTQTNICKLGLSRCKTIESRKNARLKSSNTTGKLKGYLFQLTKLWEELVVLTAKLKKPQSQKMKQEVIYRTVNSCQNVNIWILFHLILYCLLSFFTRVFL